MNSSPEQTWSKIAASHGAMRKNVAGGDSAPFGFATRVVARWQELNRSEKFRFWRRWSLRAALAALAFFLASALLNPNPSALANEPAILEIPTVTLPTP
jgi:hypothetical protein